MKRTSLNCSSFIFILIGVIGLPFIVGISRFNYYIYFPLALLLIYLSLYYFVYYYILNDKKLIKFFPARILNSKNELSIKDISHVEIQRLYAPAPQIIFYKINTQGTNEIIDRMPYNKNDLVIMIDFLLSHEVKISVNVRNTFSDDLKIIRKSIK
jgi:hypothetical protein